MESGLVRLYRGLLWLYPAEFREEYGRELCLTLVDRCREQKSRLALMAVWLHAALGVLLEAPREHYHVLIQDVRHSFRLMLKDRAATIAAAVVLALGIGSATTVFTLVNGILVRPLPYANTDRMVAVAEYGPTSTEFGTEIAFPNYQAIRARSRLLEDFGLYFETQFTIRGDGSAEMIPAAGVSDGVFNVLGVRPLMGRLISRQDDVPKGPNVVLIGHDLWARRYGADPGIVGKTVEIRSTRRTVIGVMPAGFRFPDRAEAWVPLQLSPKDSGGTRQDLWLHGVALLRPGVTVDQATDELRSLMKQINQEQPESSYGDLAHAMPFRTFIAGYYRAAAMILLAAVGFLLLIACANITNLLLVKASVRTREMALRAALGASRKRLVRQLITESTLLALIGGAAGVALAVAGVPLLLSLIPIDLPLWMKFSLDWRVLGFAAGISFATSLIFGVVPALGATQVDVNTALREGGRSGTAGVRRRMLRNGLVIAEVALSLTLLAGAGLMVRSFVALRTQSLGFQPEHVLDIGFAAPGRRYPDGPKTRALLDEIKRQIASLPGVSSFTFSSGPPLLSTWGRSLTVEGYPVPALKDAPWINHTVASPGYFRTLGIPIVEGRDFTDSDWDNPYVTIVDQKLAQRYWPNQSAIGKRIRFGPPEWNEPWHTVVGVVGNVINQHLVSPGNWNTYIPASKNNSPSAILLRSAQDPETLGPAIRKRIAAIDPDIAVERIFTMDEIVDRSAWRERFIGVLFSVFSILALILAAVGLYGVLAYTVSLRTHEIGIRMALGASAREVQAMVLRYGVVLAGIGLAAGMVAALLLTRLLATQLYRISPTDPETFAGVLVLLIVVSLVAAFIPARRATQVEPVIALREE